MHNREHNHNRHRLEDKCPPNSLHKCPPTTAATAKIGQMSSKHNRQRQMPSNHSLYNCPATVATAKKVINNLWPSFSTRMLCDSAEEC